MFEIWVQNVHQQYHLHYHKFYSFAARMHYQLFISIFRRNKVNCYCQLNFPGTRFLKINYYMSQVGFNCVRAFFVPKITYSYWFIIRALISIIILSLIALFSFSKLKRFLMFLIMFSSGWCSVFCLLDFFPFPYTVCLI